MSLALVSSEFLIVMGVLVILVGVPLFVLAAIAVVTGYIQHDAERYLEELEAAEGGESPTDGGEPQPTAGSEPADDRR